VYSLRAQVSVTLGRATDYETRAGQLLEVARGQPGFQGGALLNSLSYPAQYTLLSNWENRQAGINFGKSQVFQSFLRDHPNDNLFSPIGTVEAYEVLSYKRQTGGAGVAYLATRTINQGQAQAYQQSREQLINILQQQRGIVTTALSRLAGSATQWAFYISALSDDDLQAAANSQALQQWSQQHLTAYDAGPSEAQTYAVVLAHVPAQV
jgi:heme-degrading monooxygenase HmoA